MKPRIIIVGGGAIGLSLAWELSQRDCEVTIIDQGELGQGTTWTASGTLPPANLERATDPLDRLRGYSHQLYPQWSERLLAETGCDIGLRRSGAWYLADSGGERAVMAGMVNYWKEMAIECEPVSPSDLSDREPALSAWVSGNDDVAAWWTPDEYQLEPPRLVPALIAACLQQGVITMENRGVIDLDHAADSASVTLEDGTLIEADHVVLCTGVWTGKVSRKLQLDTALIPIRGQILLLKTPQPLLRGIVNLGNRYLVVREDGHTLIGSCEEEVGFNTDTDETMLQQFLEFATSMVPALKQAERVAAWSGLRPMTFDGFPMIGSVPENPRWWVAAGHYRSGIHLAPGTAIALADTMLGKTPTVNLDAFRVGKQQTSVVR